MQHRKGALDADSNHEDLLREAEQELEQDQDTEPEAAWGELWRPDENEHRVGRFVGASDYRTFGRTQIVYLFVDHPGEPRPFYVEAKTRLTTAMDEERPVHGDIVLLKRGVDKDVGRDNPMQRWVVKAKPCALPMPGRDDDGGLPF